MQARIVAGPLFVFLVLSASSAQTPLSPAFTYQGRLKSGGSPADGPYNLAFRLFNALSGGSQIGNPVVLNGVDVQDGLFTVVLNAGGEFGGSAFNGERRWLQITVAGVTLSPRQELTAAPYARFSSAPWASGGANIYNVNGGNVGIGTATPAQKLSVAGTVESTAGGFMFPDGTTQATATFSPWTPTSTLRGWGNNSAGQASPPPGMFTAVFAGFAYTLAIRNDGSLAGWGQNNFGQLNVPSGMFIAVAGGNGYGVAIRGDGTLAGWGYNANGQTNVPSGTFISVSGGLNYGLAIRSDGTLAGWGENSDGQISVPSGTYIAVACGYNHSLAIRSDGTLAGWGSNNNGVINVPTGTFTAVAAGAAHSLAIRTDGRLAGWGNNTYGQINVPPGTFGAVAAGELHSLAIRSDGTLAAWGNNNFGQLDNVPSTGTFTAVAAGDFHNLAIVQAVSFGGVISGNLLIDGNVGIGTDSPTQTLDVVGNIRSRGADFILNGRGGGVGYNGGAGRALVDGGDGAQPGLAGLMINFGNDFGSVSIGGNVGIGTISPGRRLQVGDAVTPNSEGIIRLASRSGNNPNNRIWDIGVPETDADASGVGYSFMIEDTQRGTDPELIIRWDSGYVGIGTIHPDQLLSVNGIASKPGGGSWASFSDARLKKDITPLTGTLDRLLALRGCEFEYLDPQSLGERPGRRIGMIAQEVEPHFPDWVSTGARGYKSLSFSGFEALTVEALRDLRAEKDRQLAERDAQIAELTGRLEKLEALMNKMSK